MHRHQWWESTPPKVGYICLVQGTNPFLLNRSHRYLLVFATLFWHQHNAFKRCTPVLEGACMLMILLKVSCLPYNDYFVFSFVLALKEKVASCCKSHVRPLVEIIFTLVTTFKRLNLLHYVIKTKQTRCGMLYETPMPFPQPWKFSIHNYDWSQNNAPKWLTSDQPQSSKLGHLRVLIPYHVWALGRHRLVSGRLKGFLWVHTCHEINKFLQECFTHSLMLRAMHSI